MTSLQDLLSRYSTSHQPAPSLVDDKTSLPVGGTSLDVLQALFDKRKSCPSPVTRSLGSSRKIIAVCLVIVDELLHEEIWKAWLNSGNEEYSGALFIHAKNPEAIRSSWVKQHTLQYSFRPEWNSPEVVRAMLSVLAEAVSYRCEVDDVVCQRMIFATESCIPVYALSEVGSRVFQEEKSWLDAYHTPKNKYEAAHCFQAVDKEVIPSKAVWKSLPGWIMLTRAHAEEILALLRRMGGWEKGKVDIEGGTLSSSVSSSVRDLVDAFGLPGPWREGRGVHAPEEIFFPTMLALLGYLREQSGGDQVVRRSVTFAEWLRKDDANPIVHQFSERLLSRIKSSTMSVFARKFKKGSVDLEAWQSLVLPSANCEGTSSIISGVRKRKADRNEEGDGLHLSKEERVS
eukprot:gene11224-12521_t